MNFRSMRRLSSGCDSQMFHGMVWLGMVGLHQIRATSVRRNIEKKKLRSNQYSSPVIHRFCRTRSESWDEFVDSGPWGSCPLPWHLWSQNGEEAIETPSSNPWPFGQKRAPGKLVSKSQPAESSTYIYIKAESLPPHGFVLVGCFAAAKQEFSSRSLKSKNVLVVFFRATLSNRVPGPQFVGLEHI